MANGYLHKVIPIIDKSGEVMDYVLKPFMVEFKPRDVMQVAIGAALLGTPMAFTEEVWVLGSELPLANCLMLSFLSLLLIGVFVYFNFYRFNFKGHEFSYVKRVLGTYLITLSIIALILTIVDKCPWGTDNLLAIKRILIVSFPAAMSGTISDTIK